MKTSALREVLSRKMLILLALGFSSGMPLLLVGGTLKIWLKRADVDISTIGYFSWVGMAYSLKFFWAPLLDRFQLFPVGRRRSWMMMSQVAIAVGLIFLGTLEPTTHLALMAATAVFIAFFSATQDIAIDAYRREICEDNELAMGSTMYQYGYRIAMILTGGIGVGFVGAEGFDLSWGQLYFLMSLFMGIGFLTTVLAPEPQVAEGSPKTIRAAVVDPLKEFLKRDGAIVILAFVFLFKLGDALGGSLLTPYYVDMGYSNADIGYIAKTVGLTSSLLGMFIGGIVVLKAGMYRSLWIFGVLQALSTAGFALITFTGPEKWALAATVVFEDVSAGMGNVAFVAFIASVCNRRYTATQYAILSSIALLGRTFFSGFMGDVAKNIGWANFFYLCGAIAIPGLLMLGLMRKYEVTGEKP